VAPFPITATSANISSRPPADTVAMVEDYFNGLLDLVVDGGRAPGGLPSTIIDVSAGGAVVLRPGAVTL
jgi:tRNA A37 threonylcarbamoyladenosine synthetase subunit TsaC/SUA5/YrdC